MIIQPGMSNTGGVVIPPRNIRSWMLIQSGIIKMGEKSSEQ
jgi:hypothetical protein